MQLQSFLTVATSFAAAGVASAFSTGFDPKDQNNMNFKTTSLVVTQEYAFGEGGVRVEHRRPGNCTEIRDLKPRVMDVSPAACYPQCTPGSFQPPNEKSCQRVIDSLLRNTTGSLDAEPMSWIHVYYKTCVVVFENPNSDSLPFQLNWAILGAKAQELNDLCFNTSNPEKSIGGQCIYASYQGVQLSNVQVSLQRFHSLNEGEEEDQNFSDTDYNKSKGGEGFDSIN